MDLFDSGDDVGCKGEYRGESLSSSILYKGLESAMPWLFDAKWDGIITWDLIMQSHCIVAFEV